MEKSRLRKVGRALETGGLSLILERGDTPPKVERTEPTTKMGRFFEVLATGGYSLISRHAEVEQQDATQNPQNQVIVSPEE